MKKRTMALAFMLSAGLCLTAANGKKKKGAKGGGKDDWNIEEYSGERSDKTYEMAMASKGFAWLSGSPADNEKLAVGKNAQFFGFVAVRYGSGRAAKRGTLGRAFMSIANEKQKQIILKAVKAEEKPMDAWWANRSRILRLLEKHLYTGEALDEAALNKLAQDFGKLNAQAALWEAKAFAAVEDSLTEQQWKQLRAWRADPASAESATKGKKKKTSGLSRKLAAQYEDLFAKCFSWLTGSFKHDQVLPLGQPAQFFGFVSIRHKSGHGASRGKISKQFRDLLNETQNKLLKQAVVKIRPEVEKFMSKRDELLREMAKLRSKPTRFSLSSYSRIAAELGRIEIRCALIEARLYRQLRVAMTEEQLKQLMEIRSDYIIDQNQADQITGLGKRGEKLFNLCSACHQNDKIAPPLKGIFGRDIGSHRGFAYSLALKQLKGSWNGKNLDDFLRAPAKYAPGTRMGFSGLLKDEDRQALIDYLKKL